MAKSLTSAGCVSRSLDEYRDLLPLHAGDPERYPFLLESVAHGSQQARYDILFAFPGARLELVNNGVLRGVEIEPQGGTFLDGLDCWYSAERSSVNEDIQNLPFRGGWFLYLGYELVGEIEPVLKMPASGIDYQQELPHAAAVRCPAAIIRDHNERRTYLVAESGHEHLLDLLEKDFSSIRTHAEEAPGRTAISKIEEENPDRYLDQVNVIKQYIVEGDVFQVNLSRKWQATLEKDVLADAVYEHLRTRNPAPFAGIARLGNVSIISSSPERLVKVSGNRIQTRPIAGTRPRGEEAIQDQHLSDELLGHPKEQAEHIMLIDLERNDLGRVCETGTIEVNELMILESYAHVHHIVSNVQGILKTGTSPGEIIRAVFPGGTITGCPKVRCMEIIAELEQEARGAYTGSMGYLNRDGDMDLNILIRTLVHSGNHISLRAGAGIVYDSDPEHELNETRAKAKGLLLALQRESGAVSKA